MSAPRIPAAPAFDSGTSTVAIVTLSVPGMNCAGCIAAVEHALNDLTGVSGARVNLTLRRVSAYSKLPAKTLIDALGRAGFEAFALDNQTLNSGGDPVGRSLLLRLGVAGFAMMNVMLLSVAVWSGAEAATRELLHLVSAAIAVPVVAYSAQPFLVNAWSALRAGRLNMDVPISLAIGLATAMSLYETLHDGRHAYFDAALALTFFLLIGRFLEHRTKRTARSAARDLAALEVHTAERWNGTRVETMRISSLAEGDRVYVATGARVPADGTLQSEAAATNRSFLSGESEPVNLVSGGKLHAGEINIGAPFTMIAEAVGEATTVRQIARLVEQAENSRNRYTALADRAARIYAPAVHILAAMAFLGWYIGAGDVRQALNIAIAVLIITCPCALGLAVPAVATAAIGKLYQMGFLVKSGVALERLAEIDLVIFDKTGTLTDPTPTLDLQALSEHEKSIAAALAQASGHPVSRALRKSLAHVIPARITDVAEQKGQGIRARCAGMPVGLGRGDNFGSRKTGTVLQIGDSVHSLAYADKIRPGTIEAIRALTDMGLELELLSGDSEAKTSQLASQLGIRTFHSGHTPQDKHQLLQNRAAAGRRVCMVGDGLNDTIAMAGAHASVAPGTALDAARTAADVVLVREGLADLPELFRTARKATLLSRQNFAIAALYNLIAVPVALAGFATPLIAALAMSTSSLTVLVNAVRARM